MFRRKLCRSVKGDVMKTSSGPKSVGQQLNRIAIATILAGVGLVAFAWPAEAKIVYTRHYITIGPNGSYNLDLNNDGVTDFTITASTQITGVVGCGTGGFKLFTSSVSEIPASGNGAEGSPPAALSTGDQIGPSQTYYEGQGTLRSDDQSGDGKSCDVLDNYSGD